MTSRSSDILFGSQYVIRANGGFSFSNVIHKIKLEPIPGIGRRDTTDAVQLLFPAAVFNQYRTSEDTVVLSPKLFSENIQCHSVYYMGNLEKKFNEYKDYLNDDLFGNVFSNPLFVESSSSSSCMTPEMLYTLLSNPTHFVGELKMTNITETLQTLHKTNVFQNRKNEDSFDGFLPGDLMYVEDGITFTTNVHLKYDNAILSLLETKIGVAAIPDSHFFEPSVFTTGLLLRLV